MKLFHATVVVAFLVLATQGNPATAQNAVADADEMTGSIYGSFRDVNGKSINLAKAAVFLCDQETGWPIHVETKDPMNPTWGDLQIDKPWVTETREDGSFEFQGVKPGTYRIVGQSWSGTEGFPGFDSNYDPSAFVILHGVTEDVIVEAGERALAYPRQLGDHTLKIVNDPEEAHALLIISLGPTLGDGILGPLAWGEEFRTNWIGVTQMEVPHVTIAGLPEDRAVHASLLNYDNNPGMGAASFEAGQREGSLRIIASWSNGHKTPPPELEELTNHIIENKIQLYELLPEGEFEPEELGQQSMKLVQMLRDDPSATLPMPGMEEQKVADILAAFAYARMQERLRR